MTDIEKLDERLAELQAERATLDATRTREDLAALADDWLKIARSRASGSIGFVLNGHSTSEDVSAVLAEYALQDPKLGPWLVARIEQLDTAKISARSKAAKLKKLDEQIARATAAVREARKQAALDQIEREFAGEAA